MLLALQRSFACIVVAAVFLSVPYRVHAEAYVEAEKTHSWFSFSKPAKSSPSEQMDHARSLLKDRQLKKASKAFRSLVITWPSSPEAPMAQWAYARLLDERGKLEDAFDAYQILLEKYAGRFPDYDKALNRQFEIAKAIMTKKRGVIFFGGFEAPERAIPYFESVIKNGPRSKIAPEAQYLIGTANEQAYAYDLAVVAYSTTLHRYPLSPFAEEASFARARSLIAISEDYPNDPHAIDEAWAGVNAFLRAYPGSDFAEEAKGLRDTLFKRRAKAAHDVAVYYDTIAKRPKVALENYCEFVNLYPESPLAESARARIVALEAAADKVPQKETDDEN